jgi:hypothetical protein
MITIYRYGIPTSYDVDYCCCAVEHFADRPETFCFVCSRPTYSEVQRRIRAGELTPVQATSA